MKTNDYHFVTYWKVQATCQEVCDILDNAEALAKWWPAVYLDVKVLDDGDNRGVGKIVELYTKGWLPYTLRWKFKVTASDAPFGYTIEAIGDFEGKGVWTFEQRDKFCHITYDWRISAEKGLLKNLSFVMKPLFSWNHRWAMKKGEESLRLELTRRKNPGMRLTPPQPTFPHNITNNKVLGN